MKYKCMIADDELPEIKILQDYIESLENLEIIGTCNNVFQTIDILTRKKVDLLFLGVNLPRLLGADFFKNIQYPPKVIFIAPDQDYVVNEFELEVIDYIPKPVSFERFLTAVIKFCYTYRLENANSHGNGSGFIYFRSERKMVKVILEDVTYIESLKDYVVIHRQNGTDLKVKYAIGIVENMLPHDLFLRIHRSFIVSIKKVTAFTNNDVEIETTKLPIGRSYPYVFRRLTHDNLFIPNEDME